jgi:NAD-dependent DNA ligase (contains BRCT domain type II)
VLSTVSKKRNYLVIGEKPTNKKIEQAKKRGAEIISQSALNNLLN